MIQNIPLFRKPQGFASLALSLALVLGVQASSIAQTLPESTTPAVESESSSISETKRQLIYELLEMTGGQQQYEQMQAFMYAQMQQQMMPMMTQMLQNSTDLSPEDEEAAIAEISSKINTLVTEFSSAIQAEITYDDMLEQVYYPVYDQFFTEDDLQGLIAFYETPLGEKLITVMPELLQTSVQRSNEVFVPRMLDVLNRLMQDMLAQPLPNP